MLEGKGAKVYLKELLQRIRDFVKEETLRGKYIQQIEMMSLTRDLQDYIYKEVEKMALTYDLERDIRFKQGLAQGVEKGLAQGLEKGLVQGVEKGLAQGLEKGLVQGLIKGEKKGLKEGQKEGQKKGLLEGIELALDIKFGGDGLTLMAKIRKIDNLSALKKIKEHIRKATDIGELVRLIG
ncbi:MAG: hypothetical protein HQL61_09435 [Magnetococcales bacterium]|nr:hypothetical protein [Nitrospirota bacterium]